MFNHDKYLEDLRESIEIDEMEMEREQEIADEIADYQEKEYRIEQRI